jgi:hypothetical protein
VEALPRILSARYCHVRVMTELRLHPQLHLPVLPTGAGSCRGSSQSRVCPERSGGTRRPQAAAPLTGSFRGDSMPGAGGRSGRSCRRGHRECVTTRGRAGGGCGVTALRQRPAPVRGSAEAAGQAAAHDGEDPRHLSHLRRGTTRIVQHNSPVRPRPLHEPGQGRTAPARRRRALGKLFVEKVVTGQDRAVPAPVSCAIQAR